MIKDTITNFEKDDTCENPKDNDMNDVDIEVVTSPDGKCSLINFCGRIIVFPLRGK